MEFLLNGIKFGLVLCILLGPIFFALIQAGVEEGIRAGTMVGLGIWISDLIFIFGVYLGLSYVRQIVALDNFTLYLGVGGSITLLFFGIGALVSRPPSFESALNSPTRSSSYFSLWLKGFLINTINPFTVFFWMGLMSTLIIEDDLNHTQSMLFFTGILGTIIATDFAKVLLAKKIRKRLKPVHVLWLRRISGAALIAFGIALLVRVWVF